MNVMALLAQILLRMKYRKPDWDKRFEELERLCDEYCGMFGNGYDCIMAAKFAIPLVAYGENVSYEYGGGFGEESYSVADQILRGVASDINWDEIIDDIVSMKDLALLHAPSPEQMNALDPINLSYFLSGIAIGSIF